MILLGAVTFGVFLFRTVMLQSDAFSGPRDFLPYVTCFLIPGTIACLLLALIHGRSAPGRGLDSPGTAAAAAATCVITLQCVSTSLLFLAGTRAEFIESQLRWGRSAHPGSAVIGLWAVLWLSGRWSPGRTWVDRSGLVWGAGWIGLALANWLTLELLR